MRNKGFTLVELLIYTGISVIIGGLTVGTLLTVTKINQNASATSEVSGQMNFVLQRLQQLVSESSNIDIDAGVTTSTVKLRMQDSAKDPTCISLASGTIKIAEGPGSPNPNNCNSTVSDLTNSKVIVNTLNFKKMVSYPGHDTLSLDMTMTYNTSNPSSQVSRSLSSAIARVSAATFDSNLLPGSDNQYEVGYTGQRWKNISISNLLNVGQLTTDPTDGMANGSIYYNTSSSVFRGYQNSAWANLGSKWSASSTAIYYNGGNVGVGTATPNHGLSVYNTGRDASTNLNGGNSNTIPALSIQSGSGTWASATDGFAYYYNSTNGNLDLYRRQGGASDNHVMTITRAAGNVGIGTTTPATKLVVSGTITADAVYAPGMTLQTVYKTWNDLTTNAVSQTYADITASDLIIVAKRTNSIFKITVSGQGYCSVCSGTNLGIKYVGTGAMVIGTAGASGDTWMGSTNGAGTNSWSITRIGFHNPGVVAGTSYTYRAMLGLWTAGTTYSNYATYTGGSTITIEEIAQ